MLSFRRYPIAVFAYNRLVHLQLTLEALERCDEFAGTDVFIYCDAPKSDAQSASVLETREFAKHWANRTGAVVIDRPGNLGFANITEGITELCERFGRVIVVEDDIVVAPDFLRYMRAALERYESEPSVFMISGFMYADAQPPDPPLFFLPIAFIWGWATWARAWKHYDGNAPGWEQLLANPARRNRFDVNGGYPFSTMLEATMTGKLCTWDIQWTYAVFNAGGLCLCPWRSLTWNSGVGCGVHGSSNKVILDKRVDVIHGGMTRDDFRKPSLDPNLRFPADLTMHESAFDRLGHRLRKSRSMMSRAYRWWQIILRALKIKKQ